MALPPLFGESFSPKPSQPRVETLFDSLITDVFGPSPLGCQGHGSHTSLSRTRHSKNQLKRNTFAVRALVRGWGIRPLPFESDMVNLPGQRLLRGGSGFLKTHHVCSNMFQLITDPTHSLTHSLTLSLSLSFSLSPPPSRSPLHSRSRL